MEEEKYFDYTNEPGLVLKKNLAQKDGEPLVSIITPFYNAKDYIKQTAYSVLNQTFPYWEWIIINDGSNEEGTKEILDEIAKLDSRINIMHRENKGRIVTRDEAIQKAQTDLIFLLDADDLIEETMLECAYWTMQTNPEVTWVYSDLANFDAKEFLWKKEFDVEVEKKENLLTVTALIKKQAILDVGGFNVVDQDVHEDWHLWLRLLEKGYFPARMNFYGFWYRQKKSGGVLSSINHDQEKDIYARNVIKKQAEKVTKDIKAVQFPTPFDPDYDTYPYRFDWKRKPIYAKGEKYHLLFIFPWFHVGGADKFNYDLISGLDKEKYDITIVTTEPSDYIWRSQFEKHATIFDLTSFLQRKDWASFMHYLIFSREIDFVMQSNSFYGYYALPWLKAEFPKVVFTDYIHCENWSWRNGEYPRESTALSRILDKTYTCTNCVANIMKNDMERTNLNMKTVYIGVDPDEFQDEHIDMDKYPEITKWKSKYEGKKVILYLARIVEEKRPLFVVHMLKKICEKRQDIVLFVVGDGPQLNEMKKLANKFGLENYIIFFGMQKDAKPFYHLAHLHLIVSLTEGLTLTTYESLAMKTPVVTADVGGQKELVDLTCGRVVENIQNAKDDFYNHDYKKEEINRYVRAVEEILNAENYEEIRQNGRKKIEQDFSIRNMVHTFNQEIEELIKEGTSVNQEVVVQNKELYKQYLVIFNQLDKRSYGVDSTNAKFQYLKDRLWTNPLWRTLITFLQKTGIMKLVKRNGIDKKIKEKIK